MAKTKNYSTTIETARYFTWPRHLTRG